MIVITLVPLTQVITLGTTNESNNIRQVPLMIVLHYVGTTNDSDYIVTTIYYIRQVPSMIVIMYFRLGITNESFSVSLVPLMIVFHQVCSTNDSFKLPMIVIKLRQLPPIIAITLGQVQPMILITYIRHHNAQWFLKRLCNRYCDNHTLTYILISVTI